MGYIDLYSGGSDGIDFRLGPIEFAMVGADMDIEVLSARCDINMSPNREPGS